MYRKILACLIMLIGFSFTSYASELCHNDIDNTGSYQFQVCINQLSDSEVVPKIHLAQSETIHSLIFGGDISVSYPDGWFISEEYSHFLISNHEESIESDNIDEAEGISAGTIIISLTIIPNDTVYMLGIEGEVTPVSVMDFFSTFIANEDFPEFTDTKEVKIGEFSSAYITASDDQMSVVLYIVEKDGDFIFGFGATHPEESYLYTELIQAIIASATFTPTD